MRPEAILLRKQPFNHSLPGRKDRDRMSNSTLLIVDSSILAVILLLGLLAKRFPRSGRKSSSKL